VIFSPAKLQLVKRVPTGRGWLYEPKFDGYRGIVARESSGRVLVRSRNDKDLGRFFPELIRLAEMLPAGTVIDGEIVRPVVGGCELRRASAPTNDPEPQGESLGFR
jgi:ATP-dependent DNA ligase